MTLSIVVIFHDMPREAARTLHSLSPAYQQGLVSDDYQVIAIDNGSSSPLDAGFVRKFGPQFSYHYLDTSSVSPADAVNLGGEIAEGEFLAVVVDGARMATPGLIGQTQRAARLYDQPLICVPSWHLGPDVQNRSMLEGYDQTTEDQLLAEIGWPADGYRLFSISTLAQSSEPGFLAGLPKECSWIALRRDAFASLGGFERRFQSPGGGLVNHDFRNRAITLPGVVPIMLLGEGVFHQIHGGVATNVALKDHPMKRFSEEYHDIRSAGYVPAPAPPTVFLGQIPDGARRFLNTACTPACNSRYQQHKA